MGHMASDPRSSFVVMTNTQPKAHIWKHVYLSGTGCGNVIKTNLNDCSGDNAV